MTDAPTPPRPTTEQAGFEAWQGANDAAFPLLMAYKYGNAQSLIDARRYLSEAIASIDAALAASDASDQARRVA